MFAAEFVAEFIGERVGKSTHFSYYVIIHKYVKVMHLHHSSDPSDFHWHVLCMPITVAWAHMSMVHR